jgi:hypothetical protein
MIVRRETDETPLWRAMRTEDGRRRTGRYVEHG